MPSAAIVATPAGGVVLVVMPVLPAGRDPVNVRKSGWIVPRCHWPHWFTALVFLKSLSRAIAAPASIQQPSGSEAVVDVRLDYAARRWRAAPISARHDPSAPTP